MAPLTQLDKEAWGWAQSVAPEDVTEEHVELAYRVNIPACSRACKRNCRGNPNCLAAIGEKAWLGEEGVDYYSLKSERRDENAFAGLANLGATCYVNAFLQVWFHNLELRRCLYRCRVARVQEEDAAYEPRSVSEHLQCLFALLQNSERRHVDPSGLVAALGLDTRMQQDAQEFSKLFLTLLEDSLASEQTEPALRRAVQTQFCGELSYVTTCDGCGRVSPLPSTFYELELGVQGGGDLAECLSGFLREEKLDGDNRYFCGSCGSKQSAGRRIQLHALPPTLNLQLMRFVFNRKTGRRTKVRTHVGFPELLDMGPFLERTAGAGGGGCCLYELSAVLTHCGKSAYSGHYVAHVREPRTGDWYEFNDGRATRMGEGAKALRLDKYKAAANNGGHHYSRDAYMLVYKVRNGEERQGPATVEVPAFLQRLVDQDNVRFEVERAEAAERRRRRTDKRKEVRELLELLPAACGHPYEFVPLEWLRKWLRKQPDGSPGAVEIDNSPFVCPHGKMRPDKVCEAKRVSAAVARLLYERYGGGPRLDAASSLCRECVAGRCQMLRLKSQLSRDAEEVSRLVKGGETRGNDDFGGEEEEGGVGGSEEEGGVSSGEEEGGFWVGRASLRTWQRMALRQLEDGDPEVDADEQETTGTFNADVLCVHGGLSPRTEERRVVPPEAWSVLRAYFPDAPEFDRLQPPCPRCLTREREDEATASDQQRQLSDLFAGRKRPRLAGPRLPTPPDLLYAVPACFVDEWRRFVRSPATCPVVRSVDNSRLLCPHGDVAFTCESLMPDDSNDAPHRGSVALLWPNEWEAVNRLFTVDRTISIQRSAGAAPGEPGYSTWPGPCHKCCQDLKAQRRKRDYTGATIYVRKMAAEPRSTTEERNANRSDTVEVDGFSELPAAAKRPRLDFAGSDDIAATEAVCRRSSRRIEERAAAGDQALTVSASQTLRELKLQIMAAFAVAPCDQTLSTVEGRRLRDDAATLGGLGLTPSSTVVLTAHAPEWGFEGTGLLGYGVENGIGCQV